MSVAHWTEADSARAREIWAEYEKDHSLSQIMGQTAGIDPATGRIWIGNSVQAVIAKRDADQCSTPLFFIRVGAATYYRKGHRR